MRKGLRSKKHRMKNLRKFKTQILIPFFHDVKNLKEEMIQKTKI